MRFGAGSLVSQVRSGIFESACLVLDFAITIAYLT